MNWKKNLKRFLSGAIAMLIAFSGVFGVSAAAYASDTPDALRSTDIYKAVRQLNPNADFTSPNAFGNVTYNANYDSADGFETTNGKPDYAAMKQNGMCCAAFVNYYLFNYLPNVAGVDPGISWKNSPNNPASDTHLGQIRANSIAYTLEQAAKNNVGSWECVYDAGLELGKDYSFVAGDYASGKLSYQIGDVLVFSNAEYRYYHVAVYAGFYNGQHWLAHCTASPNNIGVTLSPFNGYSIAKQNGVVVYATEVFSAEEKGSIEILKSDYNDPTVKLAGAIFVATNTATQEKYSIGPTNQSGYCVLDNIPYGSYTVMETVFPAGYEAAGSNSWTVTLNRDTPNATVRLNLTNVQKKGSLKLVKTSEDGKIGGIGLTISGNGVTQNVVTQTDGSIQIDNLKPGVYTVTEQSYDKYVPQETRRVTVVSGQTSTVTFNNVLKKFQVTVTKSDRETGTAQGNGSLAGATYGIYKGEQLVDSYTTDANGQFTTRYYICDDDWSVREISPSEGYLLNGSSYLVGAEAKRYAVEFNSTASDVTEQVIKGKIALIKHTDDGSTQLETPEKGAEFEVFLKASGSYDNAKEAERDDLTCDENGFAQTKGLPYGTYTVRQTNGWEGRELIADFDVYISKDSAIYRYLINNANFESYIKIVKTDAETGKTIAYAGAAFRIYNPDGSLVSMSFTYPTPTTIDTFYTNADGYVVTPEKLPYGKGYSLVEVTAPYGYVLNPEPVHFDVTEDNSTEETAAAVIKVERPDMAQKGVIRISKTGEVFSTVTKANCIYRPVYAVKGLAGAVYQVTAAENIYTPDGTLRATKGEVVATVTTDAKGTAATDPLYLGKYDLKEITAPIGMVLDSETHSVELVYAGQEISVTETAMSFVNERQKARIGLAKIMAQDETFGIGRNSEILSVQFGLFAAEPLTAADGSVIPADGLLEIASCYENGNAVFTTDVPVSARLYVKEISTDSHYVLSDQKYPVVFEYAGQNVATVNLSVDNGNAIKNDLIYGTVKGLKLDRETGSTLAGAKFGLFPADEIEFAAEKAILTAESGEDGVFPFIHVPYGSYILRELQPAEGYLENTESYPVQISGNEEIIEITVLNDRIPEIRTTATVDGEKEICATEVAAITDMVRYRHLIPGKKYVLKGVLMDKTIGKPFMVNGSEITAEKAFAPDAPSGEVAMEFVFDAKNIKADTQLVVFETLYCDGAELAVHADLEDADQTVTIQAPTPPVTDFPQTGDNSSLGFWIGLGAIALGGLVATGIIHIRKKKDDDDE